MEFDRWKQDCLTKVDRSKAGNIDEPIVPLVDSINALENYYTTSSCAGRIVLLRTAVRREETEWLFKTHELADFRELQKSLLKLPAEEVLFKMESPIIHVVCRDMDSAMKFLYFAKEAGFKRSGIFSVGRKITLEIVSTERLDVPISVKGSLLVTEDYISYLVERGNELLSSAREKITKLHEIARSQ